MHEGIENTLIILGHKLRNVTVNRDFDRTLPRLWAYGGELNLVWTNLIDNAIYAVGGTGRIDIRTRRAVNFSSLKSRTKWRWNPARGPAAHLCGALLHNQRRLRHGTRPGYQPEDRRRTA